jgi:hypothetical protein
VTSQHKAIYFIAFVCDFKFSAYRLILYPNT